MRKFWHSKLFLIGVVLMVLLSGTALWREIGRTTSVHKEITQLQEQAAELERRNNQLRGLIDYLTSDQYQERAARETLNLQLPGEVAVALPEFGAEEEEAEDSQTHGKKSNLALWWNYFFGFEY